MKLQLDKELDVLRSKDAERRKDAVEEVKLLMQADDAEDRRILRGIGVGSNFSRKEAQHGLQIELENLEKKYQGDIFTADQIRELAVKYKLRFLPSGMFRASIDIEVVAKIKEFQKIAIANVTDNHALQTQFFILAPAEAFQLKTVKYEKPKKDPDPILFYKTIEGHYRMIHKWGADFTVFRRIIGWKWQKLANYVKFNYFLIVCTVTLLMAAIFPMTFVWFPILTTLFCAVISIPLNMIACGRKIRWDGNSDDVDKQQFFTEYNWNSKVRLV